MWLPPHTWQGDKVQFLEQTEVAAFRITGDNGVTTETKRRLLISKWRGVQDRANVEYGIGRLLKDVDRLNTLVGDLATQDEQIAKLTADLEEANDTIEELQRELDDRDDEMTAALTDVKYWLHDGLVHGKLVSDPRAILRKVEEVLQ